MWLRASPTLSMCPQRFFKKAEPISGYPKRPVQASNFQQIHVTPNIDKISHGNVISCTGQTQMTGSTAQEQGHETSETSISINSKRDVNQIIRVFGT